MSATKKSYYICIAPGPSSCLSGASSHHAYLDGRTHGLPAPGPGPRAAMTDATTGTSVRPAWQDVRHIVDVRVGWPRDWKEW
jgi:hypothetical protein